MRVLPLVLLNRFLQFLVKNCSTPSQIKENLDQLNAHYFLTFT